MLPVVPVHTSPLPQSHSRSQPRDSLIQIIDTRDHVILQKAQDCLWCSKETGLLKPSSVLGKLNSAPTIEGATHGLIGKIRFFEDSDWHLLLIDEVRRVGSLPPTGGVVYCIEKVSLVPLSINKSLVELNIESYVLDKKEKETKERDKLERRLKEALLHMFNGSQSFYFSPAVDLTQSTQRQYDCGDAQRLRRSERVDDRFFWNKQMISDLLEMGTEADPWIVHVIQGFIQIKTIPIPSNSELGVFKKYTPKRKGGSSDIDRSSSPLNMRSYTMIEKDGDEYISRSYSSDSDNNNNNTATDLIDNNTATDLINNNTTDLITTDLIDNNTTELMIDSEEPFRNRTFMLSSPTKDFPTGDTPSADLSPADLPPEDTLSADLPSGDILQTDFSPEDPLLFLGATPTTHITESIEEVYVIPDRGNHGNTVQSSSPNNTRQSAPILIPDKLSSSQTKPQSTTQLINNNSNDLITSTPLATPTNSTISSTTPSVSSKSRDSSPIKSINRSHDIASIASCDTDEWIDNELEEQVSTQHLKEKEKPPPPPCTEKWSKGMTKNIQWTPEGIPLITIALISRRSRHRAGTRYLRRGVNEEGHVANYVETEMVVRVDSHLLSFMIVRGSVPVFWTQSGQKYRPDPIIQRTDEETSKAFENHFEQQINLYQEQVLVSLINQAGRERPVGEAFEKHLLFLDCPTLSYVAFDFHHHCKVNQWHNINLLLDNIEEYVNRQHYFWYNHTSNDVLCRQNGVFRVNCVDCLDRTNVVQSVICREVLQTALQKLGLLSPFDPLSGEFLRHYQEIWANNGDTISKQYTGTAAMKGDLTRYGQRKLYGVMKDGYNSAHRFILSLFRDAYRQVIIDLQQGVPPSEALLSLPDTQKGLSGVIDDNGPLIKRRSLLSDPPTWSTDREEMIADIIRSCIEQLYPYNPTTPVQGWVLIEALGFSFVKGSTKEEETVLLLCSERGHICVANYNAEFEHISCCIRIPLERIERISIGQIGNILRSSPRLHMRIYYSLFPGVSCHFTFHTVYSLSPEEDKCILLSVAQSIVELRPQIAIQEQRLSRKHSPAHEGIVYLIAPEEWMNSNDVATLRGTQSPLVVPATNDGSSEDSGSNSNISYTVLNSRDSTPHRVHSRHSSIASSQIGLVNNEETFTHSGYESDSSIQDIEMSFSVPNSPRLDRRTSMISLEERSRLLSHNSATDLTVLSEEEKESEDTVHPLKKRTYAFSIDGSSDSEDGGEELHHHRMNSVLSTVRQNRTINKRNIMLEDRQNSRNTSNNGSFGDLMTKDEIKQHTTLTTSDKQHSTMKHGDATVDSHLKQTQTLPVISKRIHSESVPLFNEEKVGGVSSSGWNLRSRIKGKLFGKVRSVTSDQSGAVMSHSLSQPKVGKGKVGNNDGGGKEEVTGGGENGKGCDEEELMKEAMKSSKTRFIII